MICWLWIKFLAVILILNKMTPLIHCFCDWRVPYFPTYYPEVGSSLKIEAVCANVNFTWTEGGRKLAFQRCNKDKNTYCTEASFSNENWRSANLVLKNITLKDSGKYILELFCRDGRRRVNSFEIIVQNKPRVLIDCIDMTVYEGENITCVCKTTVQHHTATVRWIRNKQGNAKIYFSDVLILVNISRNESGTYTCVVKSPNFVNETSFKLKIISKRSLQKFQKKNIRKNSTVEIKYFNIFEEVGDNCCKLLLLCVAKSYPEPNYTILHNGKTVKDGNMYTIDSTKNSRLGQYECLAKNGASFDKRLLFVKPCLKKDKQNPETEFKIRLIVGASSFLIGILVLYVLMCCCKKCKKKDDYNENSDYDDVRPQKTKTLEPEREKHEMRLRYASSKRAKDRQSEGYEDVEQRQSVEYENVKQREQETMAPAKINHETKLRYPLSRSVEKRQSEGYEDVKQRQSVEYENVEQREQAIMAPAMIIREMRSRYPLTRPVESRQSAEYKNMQPLSRSEERLSAEYDEPEAGNNDHHAYYNQSIFSTNLIH